MGAYRSPMAIDAPRGRIPVLGETWRPVGDKAFLAAAWIVPIESVRALVPRELAIAAVLPGRTVATAFLGDYGPGSTLEYHELGINPALVHVGGVPAVWNHTLVVDSEPARIGGALVGAPKLLLPFDWEERKRGGRVEGRCTVGDPDRPLVHVRYRQGLLPVPSPPMRAATLRDELLLVSTQHMRGRQRLAKIRFDVPAGSPIAWLRAFGDPLVGVAVTGMRGKMMDAPRVARILAHRAWRPPLPEDLHEDLHEEQPPA